MKQLQTIFLTIMIVTVTILSSCGGTTGFGGGAAPVAEIPSFENDIEGISISNQMSLVSAKDDVSANIVERFATTSLLKQSPLYIPTGGDYARDKTEYFVYDESLDAIDVVNDVLCRLNQTGYAELVNEEPYKALIDVSQCQRREDRSTDSRNQSGGSEQLFEEWIVETTRESNTSEQIVNLWLDGTLNVTDQNNNPFKGLRGQLIIYEASSDNNPFGIFSFQAGILGDNNTLLQTMSIDVNETTSGEIQIQVVNNEVESFFGFNMHANAIVDLDNDAGQAFVFKGFTTLIDNEGNPLDEPRVVGKQARVAYDDTLFHARLVDDFFNVFTEEQCRYRNEFTSTVWEYNLYNESGNRVKRNSGFPIESGIYSGWAGYSGVWIPDEAGELDGLAVTGNGQNYTITQGDGLLYKRSKTLKTLSQFVGDRFNYYDYQSQQDLVIRWNGTDFLKVGINSCDENGCTVTAITPTALTFTANEFLYMWKDGLGGVEIVVPEGGLSNTTVVPIYTEVIVNPNEVTQDLTLYCYFDCLQPNTGGTGTLDDSLVKFENQYYEGATPYVYTFSKADYSLSYSNQPVVWSPTTISESSLYFWGARSGAMSTTPTTRPWEQWQQDVTYFWEVGPNPWNKFMGLVDANGTAVAFQAPLFCEYNDEDNGTYLLEYAGPGQLHGIPFDEQKNTGTGFTNFTARFVIPAGTELTCDDGKTYYVKPLVVEQFMRGAPLSTCDDLEIPTSLSGPTIEFENPEIGSSPTVTDEPRVVSGDVQDEE